MLSVKVLVTGARGQVGQAVIASAPAGAEPIAAARADLDIADRAAVARFLDAHRPDLIVNAAAYTRVDDAEREPGEAQRVNETGACCLAEAAAARGARVIQLSTDFVFDGQAATPYEPDAIPRPISVYGRTKLAGELAVAAALPGASIVLRTAWVYAPHGRNFVLTMLRLMHAGKHVRVVDDQFGTPTCAASVAQAVWAFAGRPELAGIFHWTDAGVASWYELAAAIADDARALGILAGPADLEAVGSEDYPTAARRPAYSVLDTRSTAEAIGMTPPHWRSSLRDVLGEIAVG